MRNSAAPRPAKGQMSSVHDMYCIRRFPGDLFAQAKLNTYMCGVQTQGPDQVETPHQLKCSASLALERVLG